MDYSGESLKCHEKWQGKIQIVSKVPVDTRDALSLAYTPGVAAPCLEIQQHREKSYTLTGRHNMCAVITDGSAVLGLGNIGPEAGMPVMEGKCVLFREFGGVDAFPLCVKTQNVEEFVQTVYNISGSFGGINLEDISAPRCFEIENRLKEICDIPVFHDDQHGTAVIVLAGLTNALRLLKKSPKQVKVVINGIGAAGSAVCRLLLAAGFENIILCDKFGIVDEFDESIPHQYMKELAGKTNRTHLTGSLSDALKGADVFLGFSAPDIVTKEMVSTMNRDSIIFACANPRPEIMPELALAAGAGVVATGRSDYPNQINNVLAFPGIFRGTFDVGATEINEEMKMAAAKAISDLVSDRELCGDYIIPEPFDKRVGKAVAGAVAEAAKRTGVTRN